MGVEKAGNSGSQPKVNDVSNQSSKKTDKDTQEAVQISSLSALLATDDTNKSESSKKLTSALAKMQAGQELSDEDVDALNEGLANLNKELKKSSDKLENNESFSKGDAQDLDSSIKGMNVFMLAMIAMLSDQHSSQNQISSLGKLSKNLNAAVTSWQKTSAFWLQAFYQFGKTGDESGSFAPGVTPDNINSYKPTDSKTYAGVANQSDSTQMSNMMGIWNKLSTSTSSAAQRLATTAGLPGQLTQSINSQIQTSLSALQTVMNTNSSLMQSLLQWN